jgi:uncharacterized membrane protein
LDWIHIHLMVNHFPIVLSLIGALATLAALIRKRSSIWTYAAATLVLAGLSAPVALLTGQRAEHEAEKLSFVTEKAIHQHEERAEVAMWLTVAAGVSAIIALWRAQAKWRMLMAVLALAAAVALGLAAFEGGKIVTRNPALERAVASGPDI